MKNLIICLLTVLICASLLSGCIKKSTNDDNSIVEGIIKQFTPLTQIPHASKNEKAISDYLVDWAKKHGYEPIQDEVNNVMFTVPASKGMENVPETILQGHMDMVLTIAENKEFDPNNDTITLINNGTTLTADGTSLGADDGIGIATILYTLENNNYHGPLRIIFTVNEENGMTGAFSITKETVNDSKYLINIDTEESTSIFNSSAAAINEDFTCEIVPVAPQNNYALSINISGLTGGHSGIYIDKNRLNAIKAISQILYSLTESNISFELSSISGGTAMNAIPTSANAIIVINKSNETIIKELITKKLESIKNSYAETDSEMQYSISSSSVPNKVLSSTQATNTLNYLCNIFNGVYSMDKNADNLVECSSNLGIITLSAEQSIFNAIVGVRSNNNEKLNEILTLHKTLADECGITTTTTKFADAWPINTNSVLLTLAKEEYKNITGKELKVCQTHGGLECGTFATLNPDLDIISIGFDISEPHTINETLDLTTIPNTYHLLEQLLKRIQ